MTSFSLGACCYLTLALTAATPIEQRQQVRRARAVTAMSHTALGTVRLEFTTLAPGPNTSGITGTVLQSPGVPWVIHRILMDTERGLYYGYDIELSKGEGPGQFVAAIRRLAPSVEEEFLERRWSDFCRDCRAPSPVASSSQRFPAPQVVSPGDTLLIDLLVDERSGQLVTDRATFSAPRHRKVPEPAPAPQDLKAELVDLQMAEAELRVNGRPAWPDTPEEEGGGGGASVQGDVLWVEIPGHGRAFLSLAPRAGYPFNKIGVVAGDRIFFTIDGDRYEWISKGPVATAGPVPPFNTVQSWYVWVLHDADYRPLAGRSGGVGAGFDERAENRLKQP